MPLEEGFILFSFVGRQIETHNSSPQCRGFMANGTGRTLACDSHLHPCSGRCGPLEHWKLYQEASGAPSQGLLPALVKHTAVNSYTLQVITTKWNLPEIPSQYQSDPQLLCQEELNPALSLDEKFPPPLSSPQNIKARNGFVLLPFCLLTFLVCLYACLPAFVASSACSWKFIMKPRQAPNSRSPFLCP